MRFTSGCKFEILAYVKARAQQISRSREDGCFGASYVRALKRQIYWAKNQLKKQEILDSTLVVETSLKAMIEHKIGRLNLRKCPKFTFGSNHG